MLQNMMMCAQITERDDEDSRIEGEDDASSEYTYYSETYKTASRVSHLHSSPVKTEKKLDAAEKENKELQSTQKKSQ